MKIVLLGDSLCEDLGRRRADWLCYAHGGIKSKEWIDRYPDPITADIAIISIGVNDLGNPHRPWHSETVMRTIRRNVTATKVFWIVAVHGHDMIKSIANEFGDGMFDCKNYHLAGDNLHLSDQGNEDLAKDIEKITL